MNIPPLISRTPPPISNDDDDFDDFESFVHDSIEDEVESGRSSIEPAPIPRIDDIKHTDPETVENNISIKLNKVKLNFENEIADTFNPPEDVENLEFSSFANIQLDLKCDFNCDSSALNNAVIPENHSISHSEIEIELGENLIENNIGNVVNGINNISDPICAEFKEVSDNIGVEEKLTSVANVDEISLNLEDSERTFCERESVIFSNDEFKTESNDFDEFKTESNDFDEFKTESNDFDEFKTESNDFDEFKTESNGLDIPDFSNFSQFEEKLETFDIQNNDDDDFDDFADFQSSTVQQPAAPVATTSSFIEPKTNFFDNPWPEEIPINDESLVVSTLDTNVVVNNKVWQKLQYLEDTPALKYTWSISTSNHKMLSALKIDSRNILCGPWSKSHKCLIPEGKNFEGLIPSDFGKPSCSEATKASVPEAHFDWEGSGLTNPLFMVAKEENLLQYDLNSIVEKKISTEAETILKSLPNLSYLKKPYIVFNRSVS